LLNLIDPLPLSIQTQYSTPIKENNYKPLNEIVALIETITDALLMSNLSAQERSIITTIKNGGYAAADCINSYYNV